MVSRLYSVTTLSRHDFIVSGLGHFRRQRREGRPAQRPTLLFWRRSHCGLGTCAGSKRRTDRLEMFGAPGEIRTPDPQIRSLVLYPAELRARRVLAIGFAAYWQAPAAAAGQQGSRRMTAVAAGIAGRWLKIFLGLGLGAKALAKS